MLLPASLRHDVPLCYLIGCLPAAKEYVCVWGGCRFAALRAFQMAVIYEPLRMVGLMNATRHVFGMEGPCSAITPSLRRLFRTLHHKC